MSEYVLVMLGSASSGDWDTYIEALVASGKFRGGSSLGNGVSISKGQDDGDCHITGYMRFSADNIEEVRRLLIGNPVYEAGGRIELLEEIPDETAAT